MRWMKPAKRGSSIKNRAVSDGLRRITGDVGLWVAEEVQPQVVGLLEDGLYFPQVGAEL